MNNQTNIALSAVIENATQQYLVFTQNLMQENKLTVDLIELALEKALLFVKSQTLQLYSSALIELSNKNNQNDAVKKETFGMPIPSTDKQINWEDSTFANDDENTK